eukprot:6595-Eustigmatos_ZCMA.PRE.1
MYASRLRLYAYGPRVHAKHHVPLEQSDLGLNPLRERDGVPRSSGAMRAAATRSTIPSTLAPPCSRGPNRHRQPPS